MAAPERAADSDASSVGVEEALDKAGQVLEAASEVALACHVNPDPDALGSMLGLATFLRARGIETACSFGNEPFDKPRWLEALGVGGLLVPPSSFPREPQTLVTLDCASLDRLGNLAPVASRAETVIWIDHHVSNEGLGTIPVIDPLASSTAEIVFRLLRRMGGEIPPEAAACLYAGLVTDTGRFQHGTTTPETLALAAELRKSAFDHVSLGQALFSDNTVEYLRLLGTALRRVTVVPEVSLLWTYVTQADMESAGVLSGETDDLIDVIRTAREADVAAVMKQQRDGRFKVSMRSRGGADLAAVASSFGGGGHRLASGYTSTSGLQETVNRLVEALAEARGTGDDALGDGAEPARGK